MIKSCTGTGKQCLSYLSHSGRPTVNLLASILKSHCQVRAGAAGGVASTLQNATRIPIGTHLFVHSTRERRLVDLRDKKADWMESQAAAILVHCSVCTRNKLDFEN